MAGSRGLFTMTCYSYIRRGGGGGVSSTFSQRTIVHRSSRLSRQNSCRVTPLRSHGADIKVEHGVTHGPSGNTIVVEDLIRTRGGEPMCSPNTHGRNEDEEITCAWGPESVKQDKRPRHVCAANTLSAHQFLRHASSPPACRCADNPALGLTFLRAYCARPRSTGMDVINVA